MIYFFIFVFCVGFIAFVQLTGVIYGAYFLHGARNAFQVAVDLDQDVQVFASDGRHDFAVGLDAAGMRVVEWIILIAHRNLNLLKSAELVLAGEDLLLDVFQNCQDQLVEEFPFVGEEKIEKCGGDVRLRLRQHHGEHGEDEVARVQFGTHLVVLEVLVQLGQVLHYQVADNIRMLEQARQAILEYVPQLALLYEFDEEPEGHGLLAMDKKLTHNEVHTLHIVHLLVVACERPQHIF